MNNFHVKCCTFLKFHDNLVNGTRVTESKLVHHGQIHSKQVELSWKVIEKQ